MIGLTQLKNYFTLPDSRLSRKQKTKQEIKYITKDLIHHVIRH